MKYREFFSILALWAFCSNLAAIAQIPDSILQDTKISILTCRSGDELYSTFGHTAIRVYNPTQPIDQVYNYGIFSFNTPNFYLKFMRGKLPYFLGASTMESFLREYNYEKRTVFEQELNLTNEEKEAIIQFLIENIQPENREYKYDFFFDNCATRVVDVYELTGEVVYDLNVESKTFRDLLKENLQRLVWSDFGIDLLIGARADRLTDRRDQMFLPEYVMRNLAAASVDGKKLAQSKYLVLDFEELNEKRKSAATNWPLVCTFLLLLLTVALYWYDPKWILGYAKAILTCSAIFGGFLLFMWFGTDHAATRDNWNVLWLNPLVFLYFLLQGDAKRYLIYFNLTLLVLSGLNCLVTFLPQFFNLAFLPLILTIAIATWIQLGAVQR